MEKKLAELRDELAKGHQQIAMLDQRRLEVRDTMLRISGAILVLEELLLQGKPNETPEPLAQTA
jgi:hypothetical protein